MVFKLGVLGYIITFTVTAVPSLSVNLNLASPLRRSPLLKRRLMVGRLAVPVNPRIERSSSARAGHRSDHYLELDL